MAEYTADELAEDSDEKRLEKAEKAAERKAELKWRRKQPPTQKAAAQFPRYPAIQPSFVSIPPTYPPPFPQPLQQRSKMNVPAGPAQRTAVGPCFSCGKMGEMGHLRVYCLRMQAQEKKWYPNPRLLHECTGCDVHAACVAGAKRPIPEVKSGSSTSGGNFPRKGGSCEVFVGCSVSVENITESAGGAVEEKVIRWWVTVVCV